MDTDTISEKGFNDLVLESVKKVKIYNKEIKNYWIGFPKEVKNETESFDSRL